MTIRERMRERLSLDVMIIPAVRVEREKSTITARRYNARARSIVRKFREENGYVRAYPPVYSGYAIGKIK